ncbi:MAG: CBS domain-containing protein [Acidobacteriota bacterium]|nr:MAG: CBS domain-containing protein [Acidobacteriota bacterium]
MKTVLVRDLMLALTEYATVSDEATLYDAIVALDEAHAKSQGYYGHRAVLVYDSEHRVIGKLGLFDMLMALEDKYAQIGDLERLSGLGLSPHFVKSIFNNFSFWSRPLDEVCAEAAKLPVSDIMHILTENEYIDESANLDEAIHQLIMGQWQSLIVTRGDEIIGILKLSDIFEEVSNRIRSHSVTQSIEG